MAVDPTVDAQLSAGMARGALRQADHADEAARRQSDGAAFDMRALGAAIGRELVTSPMADTVAQLNTASHVPAPQPWPGPAGGAAGANSGAPGIAKTA